MLLVFKLGLFINGFHHGGNIEGLPLDPELHHFEGVLNRVRLKKSKLGLFTYQLLYAVLCLELVRVLEQHEVLQLLSCVELEIGFFIGTEEITHLLLELPLSIEARLELIDLILEPLKHSVSFPYLANKAIDNISLILELCLTYLTRNREIPIDSGQILFETKLWQ